MGHIPRHTWAGATLLGRERAALCPSRSHMESCNVSTVGLNVCWARSRHDRSPQCHRSNLEFLLLGFTHMSSAATLFALLLFFGADHKSPFCAAWFILWSFGQPSTHSLPFGEPRPCQVPFPLRARCGHDSRLQLELPACDVGSRQGSGCFC